MANDSAESVAAACAAAADELGLLLALEDVCHVYESCGVAAAEGGECLLDGDAACGAVGPPLRVVVGDVYGEAGVERGVTVVVECAAAAVLEEDVLRVEEDLLHLAEV